MPPRFVTHFPPESGLMYRPEPPPPHELWHSAKRARGQKGEGSGWHPGSSSPIVHRGGPIETSRPPPLPTPPQGEMVFGEWEEVAHQEGLAESVHSVPTSLHLQAALSFPRQYRSVFVSVSTSLIDFPTTGICRVYPKRVLCS